MTNINIDGDIINIITKQKVARVAYTDVIRYINNDPNQGLSSKTIIEPTDAELSIINLSHDPSAIAFYVSSPSNFTGFAGFVLSDDFQINDIVEIYCDHSNPEGLEEVQIYDTSNNTIIITASTNQLIRTKKLFSGTGKDWFTYKV